MPELGINEIAQVVKGEIINGISDAVFSDYKFDTREIGNEPTLFFALSSANGNGHDFVPGLNGRKGIAAVVEKGFDISSVNIPLIVVEDSLKAAHSLASHIRKKFNKIKYIGITGSAGKTTSKEFVAQILSSKYRVFKSFRNWNNWIGLPFSLMNLKGNEEFAVFELAMSYPGIGEIDLLAEILKPDIAVILNVFPVHMEFLKTLENVAKGKSEILNYLDSDSVSFVTGDSEIVREAVRSKKGRKIFFGSSPDTNDIIMEHMERYSKGTRLSIDFFGIRTEFTTSLINSVQVENLFAAILVAQYAGMKNFEIMDVIRAIKLLDNRGSIKKIGDFTVIDETYNSNPKALEKALSWVDREFDKTKIAVIGDMLELGEKEDEYHFEAGKFFSELNFSMLITVGKRSENIANGAIEGGFPIEKVWRFENSVEAGRFLLKEAGKGSVLFFKASRGITLEDAIREIENE